jgi:hypothetical protein
VNSEKTLHTKRPDDVVETAARAICAVVSRHGAPSKTEDPEDDWESWTEEARAVLNSSPLGKCLEALEEAIGLLDESGIMCPHEWRDLLPTSERCRNE